MKKIVLIFLIILLNQNLSFSQTKSEIDTLLSGISETENSKGITKTEQGKKIITFGKNSLLTLSDFFTDSTVTKVKSECQERNLTKGEIAIIMADRIERMPYFTITGIQNCLLTYCENNLNFIEYYLWAIKRDGTDNFKIKYKNWLSSEDRKEWTSLFDTKRKKEIRKAKRAKRKAKKRTEFRNYKKNK